MAWRVGTRPIGIAVTLAGGMLLGVIANPAPGSAPASPKEGPAKATIQEQTPVFAAPRAEGPFRRHARPVASRNRVVATSMLTPRIRFERIRIESPPQQINVIVVAPQARIRPVLVQAGPHWAPFATPSSAVKRTHALAGTNGIAWVLPAQTPMLVRGRRIGLLCSSRWTADEPQRSG